MKKHEVIINMTNNSVAFWPSHCTHNGAISLLSLPSLLMKIAVITIEENITFQKMIKKSLKEDMTNFLQMPNKFSSKKRKQINKNKWKV